MENKKVSVSVKCGWLFTIIFTVLTIFINLQMLGPFKPNWVYEALRIINFSTGKLIGVWDTIWCILFCWFIGPLCIALCVCFIVLIIWLLFAFIVYVLGK